MKKVLFFILIFSVLFVASCDLQNENLGLGGAKAYDNIRINPAAKYHNNLTVLTTNTDWNNVTFNVEVEEETTFGTHLHTDNKTVIITEPGLYSVYGCSHIKFDSVANQEAKILTRITVNDTEKRCTQVEKSKSFGINDVDSLNYLGTIRVYNGSRVNLQYKVDNNNIYFESDDGFDKMVSFTLSLEKISN